MISAWHFVTCALQVLEAYKKWHFSSRLCLRKAWWPLCLWFFLYFMFKNTFIFSLDWTSSLNIFEITWWRTQIRHLDPMATCQPKTNALKTYISFLLCQVWRSGTFPFECTDLIDIDKISSLDIYVPKNPYKLKS